MARARIQTIEGHTLQQVIEDLFTENEVGGVTSINSNVRMARHAAIGQDATVDGESPFEDPRAFQILRVMERITDQVDIGLLDHPDYGYLFGLGVNIPIHANGNTDYTNYYAYGLTLTVSHEAGSVSPISSLYGAYVWAGNVSDQDVQTVIGGSFSGSVGAGGAPNADLGDTLYLYGLTVDVGKTGNGHVESMVGLSVGPFINNGGVIDEYIGVWIYQGNMIGNTPTRAIGLLVESHKDHMAGSLGVNIHSEGADSHNIFEGDLQLGKYLEGTEITDPAAPAEHKARTYYRTVAGKTQLVTRFHTGAIQVIAAEP